MRILFPALLLGLVVGALANAAPTYNCEFFRAGLDDTVDETTLKAQVFDPNGAEPELGFEAIGAINAYVVVDPATKILHAELCDAENCYSEEAPTAKIGDPSFEMYLSHDDSAAVKADEYFGVACELAK